MNVEDLIMKGGGRQRDGREEDKEGEIREEGGMENKEQRRMVNGLGRSRGQKGNEDKDESKKITGKKRENKDEQLQVASSSILPFSLDLLVMNRNTGNPITVNTFGVLAVEFRRNLDGYRILVLCMFGADIQWQLLTLVISKK